MLARILQVARPRLPADGTRSRATCEAFILGLLIGFADTCHDYSPWPTALAYVLAGMWLGFRHAGNACVCWPVLGVSLYIAHIVAIECGRQPPYVEENYRYAERCLIVIVPSGLGLLIGALTRAAVFASDPSTRRLRPQVRLLPSTTWELIVAVACIASGLGCLHRVMFPPTIYASGYDEARFKAIQQGMTEAQVIAALAQPLRRTTWQDGSVLWNYSEGVTPSSDYERRWVIFRGGIVDSVVNDYWED